MQIRDRVTVCKWEVWVVTDVKIILGSSVDIVCHLRKRKEKKMKEKEKWRKKKKIIKEEKRKKKLLPHSIKDVCHKTFAYGSSNRYLNLGMESLLHLTHAHTIFYFKQLWYPYINLKGAKSIIVRLA